MQSSRMISKANRAKLKSTNVPSRSQRESEEIPKDYYIVLFKDRKAEKRMTLAAVAGAMMADACSS